MNKILGLFLTILLAACSTASAGNKPPAEYSQWLKQLKQEMLERGISQTTIDAAFAKNYYHPQHSVVSRDRSQNEFILLPSDYLARVVCDIRVRQGREKYAELVKIYPQGVSGVPLEYLVAFWGIETNYGMNKGGYNAIEALTILSYDRRRPQFFREELYNALKIIDAGHVNVKQMESSWAGAMGHFQFMPSTFNHYAVDADKNGKIDVWQSLPDALASAAAYLSSMGWKQDEPWGIPVSLSWNFDYAQSGRHLRQKVKKWQELGVDLHGANVDKNTEAALLLPEGHRGQAYLIFTNFDIIMRWNKSENYALAVGLLSDRIKNHKLAAMPKEQSVYRLSKNEVLKIQQFINEQKVAELVEDGYLGSGTRAAVQRLQHLFRLPEDGYPDGRLLERINQFSTNGFAAPVPPQTLHRQEQASLRSRKKSVN